MLLQAAAVPPSAIMRPSRFTQRLLRLLVRYLTTLHALNEDMIVMKRYHVPATNNCGRNLFWADTFWLA